MFWPARSRPPRYLGGYAHQIQSFRSWSAWRIHRRTSHQKAQPARQPRKKASTVLYENSKSPLPPTKLLIETIIAAKIPNDTEVPMTITLNRPFSCLEISAMATISTKSAHLIFTFSNIQYPASNIQRISKRQISNCVDPIRNRDLSRRNN